MSFVIENVLTPDVSKGSDLVIVAVDGRVLRLRLEAECCSTSFFDKDSVLDVKALLGQTLLSVESVDAEDRDPYDSAEGYRNSVTKFHALILRTNAESVSLMWRNESNGYYDGTLHVELDGQWLEADDFLYDGPVTIP